MDAKVLKMRGKRTAYLKKAADARAEAVKLKKTIRTCENEAIASLARALAANYGGDMDEVYAKIQTLKEQAEGNPPENTLGKTPQTAGFSDKKEMEDDLSEDEIK